MILNVKTPADVDFARVRELLAVGARAANRDPDDLEILVQLNVYLREPDEKFGSRHMRESMLGIWQSQIGSWAARRPPLPGRFETLDEVDVPEDFAELANLYRSVVSDDDRNLLASDEYYLKAYDGHAWRMHPALIDHVNDDFLRRRAFILTPDELTDLSLSWEAEGITAVGPQLQHDLAYGRETIDRFSRHIIPRFRRAS